MKSSALAFALLSLGVSPAMAADLAVRPSRIGAIFAEPSAHAVRGQPEPPQRDAALVVVEAIYPVQPRLPGYYGRPRDFEYRNYYGTSPVTIFSRLPYACGFVASC